MIYHPHNFFKPIFLLLLTLIKQAFSSCPPGTLQGLNSKFCYKFYATPTDFFSAEAQCNFVGGNLSSIKTRLVKAFLAKSLQEMVSNTSLSVWIGGIRTNSRWTWTDSSIFNYADWAEDQPNTRDDCISMFLSNTQWYATRCKKELPYICEVPDRVDENEPKAPIKLSKHVETSTPTTTPTPIVKFVNKEVKVVVERCDSKWTYYNLTNSCYKVFTAYKNWYDAEKLCATHESHLTSIHSWNENLFVCEMTRTGLLVDHTEQIWIGLKSSGHEFQWSDGTPLDYEIWGPRDPDLQGVQEKCVMMRPDLQVVNDYFQKWDDWSCNQAKLRAFVCKKPARFI